MSQRLVTIASFDQADDAYVGRSELERRGISAVVVDAMTAATLLKMGAGGSEAKLQVHEEDVERARTVLLDYVSRQSDADVSRFWWCGSCEEIVDPGFHVCWSCSRPRKEVEDRSFEPTLANVTEFSEEKGAFGNVPILKLIRASSAPKGAERHSTLRGTELRGTELRGTELRGTDVIDSGQPPPMVIAPQVDTDELVARAWRAAIIGLFVCPPLLNIYSMCLLIRVGFCRVPVSSKSTRRFCGAILVNILSAMVLGLYRWLGWPG